MVARVRKWDLNQVHWRFLNEVIRPIRQLGNLPMERPGKVGAKRWAWSRQEQGGANLYPRWNKSTTHNKMQGQVSPVIGMARGVYFLFCDPKPLCTEALNWLWGGGPTSQGVCISSRSCTNHSLVDWPTLPQTRFEPWSAAWEMQSAESATTPPGRHRYNWGLLKRWYSALSVVVISSYNHKFRISIVM